MIPNQESNSDKLRWFAGLMLCFSILSHESEPGVFLAAAGVGYVASLISGRGEANRGKSSHR